MGALSRETLKGLKHLPASCVLKRENHCQTPPIKAMISEPTIARLKGECKLRKELVQVRLQLYHHNLTIHCCPLDPSERFALCFGWWCSSDRPHSTWPSALFEIRLDEWALVVVRDALHLPSEDLHHPLVNRAT